MMSGRPKRKAAERAEQLLDTKKRQGSAQSGKVDGGTTSAPEEEALDTKKRQKTAKSGKADQQTISPLQPSGHIDSAKNFERSYWLMKAEPESRIEKGVDVKFSIDDLRIKGVSCWDGVRNFEARNIMRDQMKIGDLAFFYHSNCKEPGIAGIAEIIREGYPDYTAFDSSHPYYDPKSDVANPKWMMVDVKFVRKLARHISLKELQTHRDGRLKDMVLIRRGRLSVQPVTKEEWDFIMQLEDGPVIDA